MPSKYDNELTAKAVRLVREHPGDYPTEWAAICAVSSRLGMSSETLRKWVRQAQVDDGKAPGVTSSESAEIRELRRKNREPSRSPREPTGPGCRPRRPDGRCGIWQ
jgi:transposase